MSIALVPALIGNFEFSFHCSELSQKNSVHLNLQEPLQLVEENKMSDDAIVISNLLAVGGACYMVYVVTFVAVSLEIWQLEKDAIPRWENDREAGQMEGSRHRHTTAWRLKEVRQRTLKTTPILSLR